MRLRKLLVSSALIVPALTGCPSPVPGPGLGDPGGVVVLPTRPSVFVRATFDSNPGDLLGSFISADAGDTDESQAQRTQCSEYIKYKEVPASGEVEELFGASQGVSARVGVQHMVAFKGEKKDAAALRIKYTASKKMQAEVDTKGLAECCRAAPEQCGTYYVSSVLMGDGRIFSATERSKEAGLEAQGSAKGVPIAGDVMYKDGMKWERKTNFSQQYFAFELRKTMAVGPDVAQKECSSWKKQVPRSVNGQYFVGTSEPVGSERKAREMAINNAREQVVKYLGEWLTQEAKRNEGLSGAIGDVQGALEEKSSVESMSQGLAKMVKDEAWCDAEFSATPNGNMQVMRVLAYFPNSERANAMRIQLNNLIEILKTKNQLTPARESAIRNAIAAVKD